MLKITEHIEFYQSNHFFIFQKINDWKSYFKTPISDDFIAIDKENNYVSISLNLDETQEEIEKKFICNIYSSYYIGLDRFPRLGLNVYIEPKLNTEEIKLDYIKILLESLQEPKNFDHLDGLLTTKFDEEWIEIDTALQPLLTPFLIAQFLSVVKDLVKKGLKKSYYEKVENLNNRIRGKILTGDQIKKNILKNQLTKTICKYQEFGLDTEVNQFLKYVLTKVLEHLELYSKNSELYINLTGLSNYCTGGFYQVSQKTFRNLNCHEKNPFYKKYNKAVQLGNQILTLVDHNISESLNKDKSLHPPFWIDMSKLFELYVFKKLGERFPLDGEVKYHQKHNRQEPDFILNTKNGIQAVVDAKYKPRYQTGNPSIDDARQLAGYTRLNSIYKELNIDPDVIIPAYFIYPANLSSTKQENNTSEIFENNFNEDAKLLFNEKLRLSSRYNKMYLQEIHLPSH
ncbi:5-methylcytosine restriction system specificity protein McrC [Elizabethkingia miricola]|uniref:5-methylcytosine restriction system specificity protein McrC n=3 Tax=Elizabethkingia miricola TaxID=172045 RepID=UPI00137548B2|nr:restriction endonuclease [Elizabethkingia miricola]NHQ68666.1 restriction endonuclease [Elizabethkingia miricola]UIO95434.1 McrC family protein [Elizabethkingia miricola]WER12232.1 restriction endonuclease [Elizabethkingia miricola]WGL72408.1 restriction endonuclease [Elizabethkingia miricola]WNG64203.1 McrC family protein [Elizabethkingia miricola]